MVWNRGVFPFGIRRLFTATTVLAGTCCLLAGAPAEAANPQEGKAFGMGKPGMIDELPAGRLRDKLNSLPPHAQARALKRLQGFSFPGNDVAHLHADPQGNIFYVDPPVDGTVEATAADTATPVLSEMTQAEVFTLHSKPGASRVVYLDVDGHVVTNTAWNDSSGYSTLDMLPYSLDDDDTTFSSTELNEIAEMWKRVAEDFAPYDIDVTTEEPASFGPNTGHILVSPRYDRNNNPIYASNAGGVAYVGVWGRSSFPTYQPALVFPESLSYGTHYIAEAATHELGHNLGLSHDGSSTTDYYSGHGSGVTDWAPIMGVGYYVDVTQWSKGEYSDANNDQDDLQIIGGMLTYRSDDHEDVDFAHATPLVRSSATGIGVTTPVSDPANLDTNNKGIIEDRNDRDLFYVDVSAGVIDLSVTPGWLESFSTSSSKRGMNLDILATLYDEYGNIVAQDNPVDETDALITVNVDGGRYYLAVEGTGLRTPADGYSDYGSLGQYFISGTVPDDFTYTDPPTAPGDLSSVLYQETSIVLQWTDPASTPESNETNYRVYRKKNDGPAEHIAVLPSDSTGYTDNNLSGGSYVYYLEVVNGAGAALSNTTAPLVVDIPTTAVAVSEATTMGLITSGSFVDTTVLSGFESLRETHQGGRPARRVSRLEHAWTITGVEPAAMVTLEVVAEAPQNSENDDFLLSYSLDNGATYTDFGLVENGPGTQSFSASLPPDTSGSVKVKVVDTDAAAGNSAEDTFNMHYLAVTSDGSPGEQAPTVTITDPAEGGTIDSGTGVVLAAVADDYEDGDLSDHISWSCDRDGHLGTGSTMSVLPESAGDHRITATVTDSAANSASDSVTITVVDPDATVSVSSLAGSSVSVRNKWNAVLTVTVVDATGAAVSDVTVNGSWSGGATGDGSCITAGGSCEIRKNNLKNTVGSVTFTVTGLSHAALTDGGGERSVTISKP